MADEKNSTLTGTEQQIEKVLLVGVDVGNGSDTEKSLQELEELIRTVGAECVGTLIQNRENIHPGTYIGKGKIEEAAELVDEKNATGIVCDDELSPSQLRNLQNELDTKVMDRTLVILDIFAARATTAEGKIQVELAQLKYRLTRLVGLRSSLSRLGGGIGTKGPGEKKLEMDRRYIKDRISALNQELKDIKRHREVARQKRVRNHMPVVAIVGYTNAGKSTLLNTLTGAGILEEDKLFATLDPTTRVWNLTSKQEILLTDTVGFIRKLPHHLVEAFRSTLEEAKYADILLHVVDASNTDMEQQMHVVYETLHELGVENKTVITLFNKVDKLEITDSLQDEKAEHSLLISAKKGQGLPELKNILEDILRKGSILIERIFPYEEAGKIQLVRKYGELLEEEYKETGIYVRAYVPVEIYERVVK